MYQRNDALLDLSSLSPADQALARDFIAYLRWRAAGGPAEPTGGRTWRFNFLEHFAGAEIGASRGQSGMELKAAEAVVGGESRPALWQHPPVQGEALVEYHVPVPAGLQDLRLRFSIGIRDGALPKDRLVAFRIRVDGWQVWSRAAYPRTWAPFEITLPFRAGDVLRLAFATDGLGEHSFAWAVWGEPELVGKEV